VRCRKISLVSVAVKQPIFYTYLHHVVRHGKASTAFVSATATFQVHPDRAAVAAHRTVFVDGDQSDGFCSLKEDKDRSLDGGTVKGERLSLLCDPDPPTAVEIPLVVVVRDSSTAVLERVAVRNESAETVALLKRKLGAPKFDVKKTTDATNANKAAATEFESIKKRVKFDGQNNDRRHQCEQGKNDATNSNKVAAAELENDATNSNSAVVNAIDSEEAAATAAVAVKAAAVDDEALELGSATQLMEAPRRGRLAQPCLFRMLCRHVVPTLGLAVPVVRRSRRSRECEPCAACTQKQRGTTAGGDGGWHMMYLRFLSVVLSIVSAGSVGAVFSALRTGGGLCPRGARASSHRRWLWSAMIGFAAVSSGGVGVSAAGSTWSPSPSPSPSNLTSPSPSPSNLTSPSPSPSPECTASTCCEVAIPKLPLTATYLDKNVCNQGT
jgi:hypothetical protein